MFVLIWVSVLVSAVAFYLADPARFTAANLAAFINTFHTEIWFVYFGLSVIRGFTLLPSTPLVLAGTLLFPNAPWSVFFTSMAGILVSSSLIYFCSEALGFSDFFESKKPVVIANLRKRLERPTGLIFVSIWAFFPFVPTDAVCYVAGTIRMNYLKFIAAVFIGESILCSFYIFLGGSLIGYVWK